MFKTLVKASYVSYWAGSSNCSFIALAEIFLPMISETEKGFCWGLVKIKSRSSKPSYVLISGNFSS